MENRELGLVEIKNRLKAVYTTIGLKTFMPNPTVPASAEDLPCLFMIEGTDRIQKYSSRDTTGFPATRSLEVLLEMVVNIRQVPATPIKTLHKNIRKAVFKNSNGLYNTKVAQNVYFVEDRTEGPFSYGLPDISVMRLVLNLIYIDNGGF